MAKNWEKVEPNIYKSTTEIKKYRVDLYFGRNEKNKIIKSSRVVRGTVTDARKVLRLHEASREMDTLQQPKKITLKEVIDNWNKTVADVKHAETTKTSNRNIQRHILEYFGDVKIKKVTVHAIRGYFASLKNDKKLSGRTINKHRAFLHALFNYMITEEDVYGIYKNPVDAITSYNEEEYNYEIYTPDEAMELLVLLSETGRKDLEIAVNLAFWCGCRREEACALEWHNVDLVNREIKICEVRTTAQGKVIERKSTKNKSVRRVGIPDWFYYKLLELKSYQEEMKMLYAEEYYGDKDFVFCHMDGSPWHPNSLSNEFGKFLKNNNLKQIRYHDLRHTNLSLLMTRLSAVDVAQLGGHKQVSTTTDIYGHAFNNVITNGVKAMDDIMDLLKEKGV